MKSKIILSTFALLFYALLGGGSFSGGDIGVFLFIIILGGLGILIFVIIAFALEEKNKEKRLKMIKKDEDNSVDFDRSVFIGDDRCKIYFDIKRKRVLIMRVMTEGVKKEYIEDFDFPGKELATYDSPVFNIYDPLKRVMLSGTYNKLNIIHQVTSIGENDKNKDIIVNNTIPPKFKTFKTIQTSSNDSVSRKTHNILIDECHGLIAISESGRVKDVFNYVDSDRLPNKRGDKSLISTCIAGNYLFIMDDFFKVLILLDHDSYKVFNYSDIIEVSYEENGNNLYTKSALRTVGGAIVGGLLMGKAGAVVGGLSGANTQNKEIKEIDVKILLRNTSRTSYVLHFNNDNRVLKTKDDSDRKLYEVYVKSANKAKDIFSVIIDSVKQENSSNGQSAIQQTIVQTSSTADELTKLAKLKSDGFLTDEEFQEQKAKLLG